MFNNRVLVKTCYSMWDTKEHYRAIKKHAFKYFTILANTYIKVRKTVCVILFQTYFLKC